MEEYEIDPLPKRMRLDSSFELGEELERQDAKNIKRRVNM